MNGSMNSNWQQFVIPSPNWEWRNGKLWHLNSEKCSKTSNLVGCRGRIVEWIYADQNRARTVKKNLQSVLGALDQKSIAINIGAGLTAYPGVINLDLVDGPHTNIIGKGHELPFKDNCVDLVIAQEVLEHVPCWMALVTEIHRVIKPGGIFLCQVPFQIGFHPGPYDCWRFSKQALEYIFKEPEWERLALEITLGHGSAFHRIAVEFFAVSASWIHRQLYIPVKGMAALLLYPVKIFDLITPHTPERDRIPGGYICLARKLRQ